MTLPDLVLSFILYIALPWTVTLELVKINPLVKTASGGFMACDARTIVDDNALFRHPEFKDRTLNKSR